MLLPGQILSFNFAFNVISELEDLFDYESNSWLQLFLKVIESFIKSIS